MQKIVIVGGGAGGLELASRLSRTLGRKKQAEITLVDRSRTHIWKPLLHEVAEVLLINIQTVWITLFTLRHTITAFNWVRCVRLIPNCKPLH